MRAPSDVELFVPRKRHGDVLHLELVEHHAVVNAFDAYALSVLVAIKLFAFFDQIGDAHRVDVEEELGRDEVG